MNPFELIFGLALLAIVVYVVNKYYKSEENR